MRFTDGSFYTLLVALFNGGILIGEGSDERGTKTRPNQSAGP